MIGPPLNKRGRPLTLTDSEDDLSTASTTVNKASRSRHASRKLSNPKDPFYAASSNDAALQKALALSIKTANQERRKKTFEQSRQLVGLVSSPNGSGGKKKAREIEQLTDTYWNESWLKGEFYFFFNSLFYCTRGKITRLRNQAPKTALIPKFCRVSHCASQD